MGRPRLVVTDDVPGEAARLFSETVPLTLVLAGGSTPRPVYQRLATLHHPWADTQVFFSDERCVPHDHPDSNYRMARETLLGHVAAKAYPFPTDCDWFGVPTAPFTSFDTARKSFGNMHQHPPFTPQVESPPRTAWVTPRVHTPHRRLPPVRQVARTDCD